MRTRTSSMRSTRVSATASRSCRGSGCTSAASRRSTSTTWSRSPALGAHECLRSGVTTIGDCSFSGAAAVAAAQTGLRAIAYLEVFSSDGPGLVRFHESRARIEHVLSDRVRLGVSPHAPYTCTIDVYRRVRGARPATGDAFLRERGRARLARRRASATGARSPSSWCRLPGETGIRLLAAEGLLARSLMAAHCVHADSEEIALLATHGVGVAHCPRSNGYLGCGVAPLARSASMPASTSRSQPTAPPRRRRSTCSRRSARRSSPRGPASAGPMPCRPRRPSSSRPSAAPACSGWTTASARSPRVSRPT